MYFRVRNLALKSGENDIIVKISKTAKIEELKSIVYKKTQIETDYQVLLYKGKQLVDDHKIFDYDIQLNDVVQLLVKVPVPVPVPPKKDTTENVSPPPKKRTAAAINETGEKLNTTTESETVGDDDSSLPSTSTRVNVTDDKKPEETQQYFPQQSKFYEIHDLVDFISKENGSWCEGKIIDILSTTESPSDDSDLIFKVKAERGELDELLNVTFKAVRPRAFYTYKKPELNVGMKVFVSYNIEEPSERGHWYDMEITVIDKHIHGTVFVGESRDPFMDCKVKFINEIMRIEEPKLLTECGRKPRNTPLRNIPYYCKKCKDIPTRKCKNCGCAVCGGKENPDKIIMCDECDDGYHLTCLNPPLDEMPPEAEWYCPECKNDENEIVKAGDSLKFSNKKSKMASNKSSSSRDWGRGMACVGRTAICTIVPINHFGPIPGVEVGTCWKYRIQVSEAGVHRIHVAGIHGKESEGAYSLVLSGGYEDDIDYGEEFYYTGSGGRDLSGNKRVNEQSSDQQLTRMNKALAMNCNAKFNSTEGAEAKDWKAGKPVRVVRNYKLAKHSKYAPKDGNRYDGIYKVVKYYPEKGISGFIVWRYLLRRDDPNPAPWSKGGQELEMIYPPGYLEAQQAEQGDNESKSQKKGKQTPTPKRNEKQQSSSKRKISDYLISPKASKKPKLQEYKMPAEISDLIKGDSVNEKLWKECQAEVREGKQNFLKKIEEVFMCAICQELTYKPVTTTCSHNVCKSCMKWSFKSETYNCPYCRFDLTSEFELAVNKNLSAVLEKLFPGYEAGR